MEDVATCKRSTVYSLLTTCGRPFLRIFIVELVSSLVAPFCLDVGQVEEAFATLQTWQGVVAGLPALVDRLRALESLHLASASFAQRLEQVTHATFSYVCVVQHTPTCHCIVAKDVQRGRRHVVWLCPLSHMDGNGALLGWTSRVTRLMLAEPPVCAVEVLVPPALRPL